APLRLRRAGRPGRGPGSVAHRPTGHGLHRRAHRLHGHLLRQHRPAAQPRVGRRPGHQHRHLRAAAEPAVLTGARSPAHALTLSPYGQAPAWPHAEPTGAPELDKPSLTAEEARVLAVLVEKQHTVPDSYPLSLNALTLGCNQKTAREPVMQLSESEVLQALDGLKAHSLVHEVSGSRVVRFDHNAAR